jgi:hypothetical protein
MKPLFDLENETSHDKQESAAISLTFEVARLLDNAFRSRTDLSVQDIAEKIGVTPERVQEILSIGDGENADGNMYVVTLGRYMRAMGYTLKLTAVVAEDEDSPVADADKVNALRRRPRRVNSKRPGAAERDDTYSKTLPGTVYELLSSIDNGALPFHEYLQTVQKAGFTAREGIQFMTDEANAGNMRIHDDGSVSAVKD